VSFNRWLGAAAVLLLVAGAGLFFVRRSADRARELSGVKRVAVLSFDNQTGDASLDWASSALPDLLARQLSGLPRVAVRTAAGASEAAGQGATHLIHALLEPMPDGVGLRYSLEETRRHRFFAAGVVEVKSGRWISATAQLATLLRAALHARGGALLDPGVSSAEALQLLGEASRTPDPNQRLALLEQACAKETACGWCWEERIQLTASLGGPPAALELLEKARQERIRFTEPASSRLAFIEANLRSDSAAQVGALERLVKLMPSRAELLIALADAATRRRELNRASTLWKDAIELEPEQSEGLNQLAYLADWRGDTQQALEWISAYEKAEPDSPNPPDSRGEILLAAGRFAEAAQSFGKSFEKNPVFQGGEALEKAALALWLSGDARGAGRLVERFLEDRANRNDPFVLYRRARWQYLFGHSATAEIVMRHLVAEGPQETRAPAAASLTIWALAAGDEDSAARWAAEARRLPPSPWNQRWAGISGILARSAGPTPSGVDPGEAHQVEAVARSLRGQWREAVPLWEQVLREQGPGADALAREMLAWSLVESKRTADAARVLEAGWPIVGGLDPFSSLVYPGLFHVRALIAGAEGRAEEARRMEDLFLRYAGDRADLAARVRLARASSRL
jgi:tetratricopeptide (TPR) repeat protein